MSKTFFFIAFPILFLISCSESKAPQKGSASSQITEKRMAAEWEPALGTIIAWPLGIPHKLVVELAKNDKLFTMVPDESAKKEAEKWFVEWGIDLENVQFIFAPQDVDAWWLRDWGPHAVFDNGIMKLADGQYPNSTPFSGIACDAELGFIFTEKDKETGAEIIVPTTTEDMAPYKIGEAMDFEVVELPFVFTGGNVLTDGRGTAFSTCIIANENKYMGLKRNDFLKKAEEKLGIENYNIISNFEENGIQHIDCFMKILDEERLLVIRPPKDHSLFPIYEDIVQNELSKMTNYFGRPYEILRLDTERYEDEELAAYSNSIIVNQNIYVPFFGIEQDSIALKQWQDAMPGYTVNGFEFIMADEPKLSEQAREHYNGKIGWNSGDALHCRTRAMWDPQMLYISVDRIPKKVAEADGYEVRSKIIDYGKKGLIENELKLFWRLKGKDDWAEILLKNEGKNDFLAIIPRIETGNTVEYFISAKSNSGKTETMPRTSPKGFYSFSIE